jgi:hypothetical protein
LHGIKHGKIDNDMKVGLFWFSDDYSSLKRIEGVKEVPDSELLSFNTIEPDGCHLEYEKDLSIPRGRVVFGDGVFDICVGTDIPESANFQAIKTAFGLSELDVSKVRVFHDHHWNKKGRN